MGAAAASAVEVDFMNKSGTDKSTTSWIACVVLFALGACARQAAYGPGVIGSNDGPISVKLSEIEYGLLAFANERDTYEVPSIPLDKIKCKGRYVVKVLHIKQHSPSIVVEDSKVSLGLMAAASRDAGLPSDVEIWFDSHNLPPPAEFILGQVWEIRFGHGGGVINAIPERMVPH